MPDLDLGPAPDRSLARTAEPGGPAPAARDQQPENPIARALGNGFRGLYTAPEIAQANYQSLAAFAGSGVANDLISNGGAGRLAPLRPDLTRNQFTHIPSALGAALGEFAPRREGALAQVLPGAHVVRDGEGVPLVAPARAPALRPRARRIRSPSGWPASEWKAALSTGTCLALQSWESCSTKTPSARS